ncbi:hypothetical protein [Nostoc sp.]
MLSGDKGDEGDEGEELRTNAPCPMPSTQFLRRTLQLVTLS